MRGSRELSFAAVMSSDFEATRRSLCQCGVDRKFGYLLPATAIVRCKRRNDAPVVR